MSRHSRFLKLLAFSTLTSLSVASVAMADNVQNGIAAGGNDTVNVGGSTTVNYRITANNGDGQNGCNAADTSPATVTINAPADVATSPTSLSFTSCGTNTPVSFSSNRPGDYEITVSVADIGTGTYNTQPATFTLHVVGAPNTQPSLHLPADITAEATGPSGATVTYSATATDAEDNPDPTPRCDPASGSLFELGSTIVSCSVDDSKGLRASGTFKVNVVDTTAPIVNAPTNMTVQATGPSGATVGYSGQSATDAVDGPLNPACVPASGSTFALGDNVVTCSAKDTAGNVGSASFTIKIIDTTGPLLLMPSPVVEATGPSGAEVTYTVTASDLVDGDVTVICSPVSGGTFDLGTTRVNCSATDAADNTSSGSFTVTVEDNTAPTLSLPANIWVPATSGSSAVVSYAPSANDLVDGPLLVSCTPPSGTSFNVGTATVECSATDASENTATGSFTVTVGYKWTGFFQPIDNLPALNKAKAGSAVPVKFSLGGSQGLGIFEAGYPQSVIGPCGSTALADAIEQTVTAGGSSLSYDPVANQYVYVWKTEKTWAGTCRQLQVKLIDGTVHAANFTFTK